MLLCYQSAWWFCSTTAGPLIRSSLRKPRKVTIQEFISSTTPRLVVSSFQKPKHEFGFIAEPLTSFRWATKKKMNTSAKSWDLHPAMNRLDDVSVKSLSFSLSLFGCFHTWTDWRRSETTGGDSPSARFIWTREHSDRLARRVGLSSVPSRPGSENGAEPSDWNKEPW